MEQHSSLVVISKMRNDRARTSFDQYVGRVTCQKGVETELGCNWHVFRVSIIVQERHTSTRWRAWLQNLLPNVYVHLCPMNVIHARDLVVSCMFLSWLRIGWGSPGVYIRSLSTVKPSLTVILILLFTRTRHGYHSRHVPNQERRSMDHYWSEHRWYCENSRLEADWPGKPTCMDINILLRAIQRQFNPIGSGKLRLPMQNLTPLRTFGPNHSCTPRLPQTAASWLVVLTPPSGTSTKWRTMARFSRYTSNRACSRIKNSSLALPIQEVTRLSTLTTGATLTARL
jgi:hypothetical protein